MDQHYDEEAELTRYVIEHFAQLADEDARRALRAAMFLDKADAAQGTMAHTLRRQSGIDDDPAIAQALAGGTANCRTLVARCLLAEGSIDINRCPRCSRVVRTPRARQCLWCGHDWHGVSSA